MPAMRHKIVLTYALSSYTCSAAWQLAGDRVVPAAAAASSDAGTGA